MPSGSAKVKVVRRGGFTDMLRSYRIFLNDQDIGSVARNSALERDVPSGPLKVEAWIDWCRSAPLMIDAAPNQVITVEVSNHWGAWLGLWAITFGRNSYLLLKQT